MELRSVNQHQKWKIHELEDQVIHYTNRISGLERRSIDLDAELIRAKADLSASRESASLRRASKTRMADEWLNLLNIPSRQDETDEEGEGDYDNYYDDDGDYQRKVIMLKRRSQSESNLFKNDTSLYQSNPNLKNSRYRSETVLSAIDQRQRRQPVDSLTNYRLSPNSKSKGMFNSLKSLQHNDAVKEKTTDVQEEDSEVDK
ncbi:unnamed protein product [Trichobilharzia regenti]|nr:unnamed protein product [Trichobilharzia regenti]